MRGSKHREQRRLAHLLCWTWMLGLVGWLGAGTASAQTPQQLSKRKLHLQLRCLGTCQERGYRQFYRCGSKRRTECNIRSWLKTRQCFTRCRAPWFCKGFVKSVNKKCATMCLARRHKKRPPFCRRARSKKARYRCLKRYVYWRSRTRHACLKLCETLRHLCSVSFTINMPPPKKLIVGPLQ